MPAADDDTAETLAARILEVEHGIYPEAVQLLLDGGWKIEGRRVLSRPLYDSGLTGCRVRIAASGGQLSRTGM